VTFKPLVIAERKRRARKPKEAKPTEAKPEMKAARKAAKNLLG
jgi:hypothetical protein